ncbi:transporter substrate-binding domain-containing protein [Tamlana agarivorans]|uniref:Transporter substrate-binding domain-containing protein n=1 Tax=Pseudotamlana agarivorans TaxID=481183 RepID=A0ACC5UCC6_9FLAO|nr:transporter substrate-binding domain-containing protein [Tamlana agarivorans]MBU2951997.1 transporter substrate-binding domain-containing protein [Tamlana agarivorans]
MNKLITLLIALLSLQAVSAQQIDSDILKGKDTIIIGYNIDPPFCFLENGKLEGISVRLWHKINKSLNDHVYIYEQRTLEHLLEGVGNGEIDMSLSPLTITSDRHAVMDFSVPYYISECKGLIKSKSQGGRLIDYLNSFFSFNFLKVIGTLLFLLTLFGVLVWFFERHKNKDEFGPGWHGVFNSIWWSAVTMTTVGYGDKSPKTVGGRFVGLIWMFTAIVLISGITASIASSLTVHKLRISDDSFDTFKNYKIGTVKKSATESWLVNHYFNKVSSYQTFSELMEGLNNDEIQALAYDEPLIRFTLKDLDDSKYEVSKFSFNTSMYAMAFSKQFDAALKNEISQDIIDYIESNDWRLLLANYDLLYR